MGWFIRGLHQGASQLMIVTVLLHMIRVFLSSVPRSADSCFHFPAHLSSSASTGWASSGSCSRRRLDFVCLRALVSRATGDCPLGERPRKCRRHHAVAGRDGCGRDRLGSRGRMVWHTDVFTGNRRIIRGLADRRPPLVA